MERLLHVRTTPLWKRQTLEVSRKLHWAAIHCCWHLNSPSWLAMESSQCGTLSGRREGAVPLAPSVSSETQTVTSCLNVIEDFLDWPSQSSQSLLHTFSPTSYKLSQLPLLMKHLWWREQLWKHKYWSFYSTQLKKFSFFNFFFKQTHKHNNLSF